MSWLEDIDYVLNPDFFDTSNELVEESAGMRIQIIKSGCKSLLFKLDKQLGREFRGGIFPFFNSGNLNVCKVCDYILFAEKNNQIFVLIIELKRGRNATLPQLKAGECFVDFIASTVNRVFDRNLVFQKRFVSIREFSRKRKTGLKEVEYDVNLHHNFNQQKFPIVAFLH